MYKLAKLTKRIFAYIIDWYLSSLCVSFCICLFQSVYQNKLVVQNTISNLPFSYRSYVVLAAMFLVLLYFLLPGMISNKYKGQSIGKMILHIRIVNLDGTMISNWQLIIRYLFGFICLEGTFFNLSFTLRTYLSFIMGNDLVMVLYVSSLIISFISILLLWKDQLHQSIHDKLAKTVVISE